jgi:signal transduction histidine kinase
MIEHVLQYSRAGTNGIQPEDIDSADIVSDVLRDYEDRIKEKNVKIQVRSLPVVRYDRTMLYLILANLISNAIKFSKKDDPEPSVIIDGRHTTVDLASIKIRDNGIGIPLSQQEKILEMGFRLHHESDYAGFGYGLAIVRRILNRCGGELGIRSREGQGSEFVLTIPAGRIDLG